MLAICRGIQQLNVAFGGSLYANIAVDDEHHCHTTWVSGAPLDQLYGPAHELLVTPGGHMEMLSQGEPFTVNSLHVQAIDRLGEGLTIEARAERNDRGRQRSRLHVQHWCSAASRVPGIRK